MPTPKREILVDVRQDVTPSPRIHYIDHPFEVAENASKVGAILTFHKERVAQIFLSLHDPQTFRGNRMNPFPKGEVQVDLWVSPDQSSEGGIPGRLPPGKWRAQVDVEHLGEDTQYHLIVYAEYGAIAEPAHWAYPSEHVIKPQPGWYAGELHCHSSESDGAYPVNEVVRAALDAKLDFLSITDHFTVSQWNKLAGLIPRPIALIRSCEITSHRGHANLQGIKRWVDVYVDRARWGFNQAAGETHRQGGLFCVNHAFSGEYGWLDPEFDWQNADMLEIYHSLEGCNNSYQLGLWDHHLCLGRKIVGVGGSDSHDPYKENQKLGQLVTYVYADELSEAGILNGLKRGKVYVSKGPQINFVARGENGEIAEMWEAISAWEQPIEFRVEYQARIPLRLFVIRNGFILYTYSIQGDPDTWRTLTSL
ncbi:MAG: CehA/McbA family metallohydrolase, partial [Chloroflexi bacterium]|nr:CehA/McbA family metallohydrolase [Chloroflexota bacterium]